MQAIEVVTFYANYFQMRPPIGKKLACHCMASYITNCFLLFTNVMFLWLFYFAASVEHFVTWISLYK